MTEEEGSIIEQSINLLDTNSGFKKILFSRSAKRKKLSYT